MSTTTGPYSRLVETNAGAGYSIIELAENEDAALRDGWADIQPVMIQTGRVGLESFGDNHLPTVQVSSYVEGPPPEPSSTEFDLEILGTWPVEFASGFVQVWSGDSYPGDQLPLELAPSVEGRYLMRVAVGRKDLGGLDFDDYFLAYHARHHDSPSNLERFEIDFWPRTP